MNQRQAKLLRDIVENHIQQAQPVGSKLLAGRFQLSSATIRNEMAELEKEGFIYQPHTSAGRVPTEKGYKYYLENFLDTDKALPKRVRDFLDRFRGEAEGELLVKRLAKALAEISKNAVIVGFGPWDVYYTGLSNLFAQPEFSQVDLVREFSQIVDHLDEVMADIFAQVEGLHIYVGSDNPFGSYCSLVINEFFTRQDRGVIGILGPMRMDYQKNYSLLNYISQLID